MHPQKMASKLASKSLILLPLFLCFLINFTSTNAQTHIHFYFHDIVSGSNPTSVTIAHARSGSSTMFGLMNMMDNKLTEGPDLSSKEVGRAQGLYASSSLTELGLTQIMNLVFTDGAYKGSVLTVIGRNTPSITTREMSVVGGTGQFRLARGYAIAKTYQYYSNGDATVEYDVYVS